MSVNKNYISVSCPENLLNNNIFNKKDLKITYDAVKIYKDFDNVLYSLRKEFEKKNIFLNTYDLCENFKIDAEFHFYVNCKKQTSKICYLISPEIEQIYPDNQYSKIKNKYDKIFTTIDDHIDNKKFFKLKNPIKTFKPEIYDYKNRSKLLCIISSNKNLNNYNQNTGYTERIKIINWFEKNFPQYLDFYGPGWDYKFYENYFLNKYFRDYFKINLNPKYKTYQGICKNKILIMKQYKFIICYENFLDYDGYFCELIFDAFNAGCIPIYWGAKNVKNYIPFNCFIDKRDFKNNKELLKFLLKFDAKMYNDYQENILKFYSSSYFKFFSEKNYIDTIKDSIINDLKI